MLERRDDGVRVVELTDAFAVLAAFAPQWEGETWIVPREPADGIATLDDGAIAADGRVLLSPVPESRARGR